MKEHILDVINSDGKAISFDDTRKAEEYFSSLDKGREFVEGLHPTLQGALRLYTMSGFTDINRTLRENNGKVGENKDLRIFDFSSMSDKYFSMDGVVDAIDATMCPLEDDVIVYRGFNNPRMLGFEEKEDVIDACMMGDISYTEHGYMSTSAVCGGRFVNECPYVMAIRLPKGTNVCYLNNDVGLIGEVEILVQRGCEVVITGSEMIDGKCVMYGIVTGRDIEPKDVGDISICDDASELERIANYCNDGGDDYMTDIDAMFDELDSFELNIDSNEKGI